MHPHRLPPAARDLPPWIAVPVVIIGLAVVLPVLAVWVPVRLLRDRFTRPHR